MKLNPVLSKELKVKMRNWKVVGMIGAYLLILTLVAIFIIINIMQDMSMNNSSNFTGVYIVLAVIQFLLIAFIAPALTSGSISGERERQTLDLLLCTKLPTRSIILGKLLSSISQIVLLVIASLPIISIVFVFGGISMKNVGQLFLFYLVMSVTMGSIGVFFSTHIKKTTTSNVVTYGFVLFLLFGTIFLTVFYTQILLRGQYMKVPNPGTNPSQSVFPLLYTNPLFGFASLLSDQFGGSDPLGIPGFRIGKVTKSYLMPWKINLVFNILFSGVLLALSAYKINPVRKSLFKFRKKAKSA